MADNTGNDLNVSIGADNSGLKKGLNESEKDLKKFSGSASKAAKSISKTTISNNKVGKSFSQAGKGAANAVPAVTEFSRVIQDAPFGIQGVANNITQLTQNFGYLKNQTGSTSSALKAMLKTLTGPAGVLLAVSAVTSLLVSYGDQLFKSSTDAEKLAKKQEELTKSLEDYEKTLNGVDKARLKGAKNAAKELTTLTLLKSQIDNTSLSENKRFEAVKRLRELYPKYLDGISYESTLLGSLDNVYKQITKSITDKAKAQAAASLITENYKKELTLQLQLEEVSQKLADAKDIVAKKEEKATSTQVNSARKRTGVTAEERDSVNDLSNEYEKLNNQLLKIQETTNKLSSEVSNQGGIVPLSFKVDRKDLVSSDVKEQLKSGINEIALTAKELIPDGGILPSIFPTTEKQEEEKKMYFDYLNSVKDGLATFSEEANNIINTGVVTGFSSMAESIGAALANGDNAIQKGGAALLGSLGGVLVQYGKLVLAYGVATSAFAAAVKNPFGGGIAAIAAGAALIAIGGAVKGFASKAASSGGNTSNVAGGGSTSNSTSSSSSGNSYSSSSSSLQNVVFEIQGTKLVGVLSNTLNRNKSLSGTLSIN